MYLPLTFIPKNRSVSYMVEKYGTITELARACGVSRQTVHNWKNRKDGMLPPEAYHKFIIYNPEVLR
jgi:DNA invertase Pin-like site-specific DNA recombinase